MDYFSRCISKRCLNTCAIWTLLYFTLFGNVVNGDRGMYPLGLITREVGQDINITCWIDEKGRNSSDIYFYYNNRIKVPPESITINNETTITFTIKNAPKMETKYTCMEGGEHGINLSTVQVGTKPEPVKDFDCKAYDYEYILCNFTAPHNFVKTTYNLSFIVYEQFENKGRLVIIPELQEYNCELTNKNRVYFCNITHPLYRQVHNRYNFTLKSANTLGTLTQLFSITQDDNVIPPKPEIKRINVTTNSATLTWKIPKSVMYEENRLMYEASIWEYGENNWKTFIVNESAIFNSTSEDGVYNTTFTNLESYMWYDVRMRAKVKTARDDGTMWSNTCNVTFETIAKKPDEPPQTDIGSFHIDVSGNLYLFWKEIPKQKRNGPEFEYVITEIRQKGHLIYINPIKISLIYAKFDSKLINLNDGYDFVVRSKNREGQSERGSTIHVPKRQKDEWEFFKPQEFHKIYHQKKYSLSWSAPKNTNDLINYTVFWCESEIESSNQCQNSINFTHVRKNERKLTLPQKGSSAMNFAVAANYKGSSSGMVWAKCTALRDSDFGKMKLVPLNADETSINITWKVDLECVYTSILEGYHLSYCPIKKPATNPKCSEEKNIIIPRNATEFTVSGLKPYTTYKFVMYMFSQNKTGPPSDNEFYPTLDAAPTPPRNLTYINLTNNSVDLMWIIPESLNGKLNNYKITYNDKKIELKADNSTHIVYTLQGLESYHDYTVSIKATNTKDSDSSNTIKFRTLIGVPGAVDETGSQQNSLTDFTFTWKPPVIRSGRLDFYEVLSDVTLKDESRVEVISRVEGTKCRLRLPECSAIKVYIRAVNAVDRDNESHRALTKRDANEAEKYFDLDRQTDVTITNISPIFKRHSYAEIDLIGYEGQRVMHQENHIRHNRQERDNTGNPHFSNYQKPIREYADDNSDYKCEEHSLPLQKLVESGRKTFLRGTKRIMWSYGCGYPGDYRERILLIVGVIISVFSLVVFYFCGQKYKRMKNIDVVLPPGLTDLDQEIHKGIDNMVNNHHDIMRSDESIFKNENHHLLAGSGNDSGYLHGINCSDKSDSYDLSDAVKEDEHSAQSDSVELSDMSNSSNVSPPESPNVQRSDKKIASAVVSPIIINGYVQPQKQLPPTVFSGYTTLDAFGKPILPPANTMNTDSKFKEPGINENICGYVTHKQLSDFGHRLQ